MSILIKGMGMPKNCYECPFGLLEYTSQCYAKTIRNKFACCITHKTKTSTKRNRFCPLVEVPKHGRLIDADKLTELCDIMADKCGGIGESIWGQFRATVEWSPTIIEAEE